MTLLLLSIVAAIANPATEQLHANVLAWSPNDVRPGEPVSVLLQLYTSGGSPYPRDGIPATNIGDVEIVLHGNGITRRFPTIDRGTGRYYASIVFPSNGGWELLVDYDEGGDIQLGKGGICVGAPICVEDRQTHVRDTGDRRAWLALSGVLVLLLAATRMLHPLTRLL